MENKNISNYENINLFVDRVISDAILFNQIPSNSTNEEERIEFIKNRLIEFGIPKVEVDNHGNILFVINSNEENAETILLFTNIDIPQYPAIESFVKLKRNRAYGRGIADNSLGVASLLVLAEFFSKYKVGLNKNLAFLFTSKSGHKKDFEGIKSYLKNYTNTILFGINVKGLGLGNIGHKTIGHYNIIVSTETIGGDVFEKNQNISTKSAITVLAEITSRLINIGWPKEYGTVLNISQLIGGIADQNIPTKGELHLELYCKDINYLEYSKSIIFATVDKYAEEIRANLKTKIISYIPPLEIPEDNNIVKTIYDIHNFLGIKSKPGKITDESAILIMNGIPTLSLGISYGKKSIDEEYIEIKPIELGLKQIYLTVTKGAEIFAQKSS